MTKATRWLGDFVGGVTLGLAVGYVVAVLLTQREGEDTRAKLLEGAEALREAPRALVDDVQARFQFAIEEGRTAAAAARAELASSVPTIDEHRSSNPTI